MAPLSRTSSLASEGNSLPMDEGEDQGVSAAAASPQVEAFLSSAGQGAAQAGGGQVGGVSAAGQGAAQVENIEQGSMAVHDGSY